MRSISSAAAATAEVERLEEIEAQRLADLAVQQALPRRLDDLARPPLLLAHRGVGGEVDESPGHLLAANPPLSGELSQRVLHPDVQHVRELVGGVARLL